MYHSKITELRKNIHELADPARAKISLSFFKTGPGEYGEGDHFVGLNMPVQRKLAKKYASLSLSDLDALLQSNLHEERMIALVILVDQFKRGEQKIQKQIFDFYLDHTDRINNWDLVDASAQYIVGAWLFDRPDAVRFKLAKSKSLWERRITVLSTFYDLYQGSCEKTIHIALMLLKDKQDLIQKAIGWMLREAGKRCSLSVLKNFLDEHAHEMPRTMLRYSIEKLSMADRQKYLKQTTSRR